MALQCIIQVLSCDMTVQAHWHSITRFTRMFYTARAQNKKCATAVSFATHCKVIWACSVTKHLLQRTTTLNLTHNSVEMARWRLAPDKNLPMSQASRQSDKENISSDVSQSQRVMNWSKLYSIRASEVNMNTSEVTSPGCSRCFPRCCSRCCFRRWSCVACTNSHCQGQCRSHSR